MYNNWLEELGSFQKILADYGSQTSLERWTGQFQNLLVRRELARRILFCLEASSVRWVRLGQFEALLYKLAHDRLHALANLRDFP